MTVKFFDSVGDKLKIPLIEKTFTEVFRNEKMKKLLTLSLLMLSGSVFAWDAEQLKQSDLKVCESKAQTMPQDLQEQSKKTCECQVKNTDYEAVAKARESGDKVKVKTLKSEAAAKCAE